MPRYRTIYGIFIRAAGRDGRAIYRLADPGAYALHTSRDDAVDCARAALGRGCEGNHWEVRGLRLRLPDGHGEVLGEAAEEFDALAEDTCGAEPEARFRELAARCREAAS